MKFVAIRDFWGLRLEPERLAADLYLEVAIKAHLESEAEGRREGHKGRPGQIDMGGGTNKNSCNGNSK